MALACLATTLIMADDVATSMPQYEDRLKLVCDVASMLGMSELVEDPDLMVCPAKKEFKDPYLKAMKFLTLVVFETLSPK